MYRRGEAGGSTSRSMAWADDVEGGAVGSDSDCREVDVGVKAGKMSTATSCLIHLRPILWVYAPSCRTKSPE